MNDSIPTEEIQDSSGKRNFVRLPPHLLGCLLTHPLTHVQLHVYLAICQHHDNRPSSHAPRRWITMPNITQKEICKRTGKNKSQVSRAIKSLESLGYIKYDFIAQRYSTWPELPLETTDAPEIQSHKDATPVASTHNSELPPEATFYECENAANSGTERPADTLDDLPQIYTDKRYIPQPPHSGVCNSVSQSRKTNDIVTEANNVPSDVQGGGGGGIFFDDKDEEGATNEEAMDAYIRERLKPFKGRKLNTQVLCDIMKDGNAKGFRITEDDLLSIYFERPKGSFPDILEYNPDSRRNGN